MIDISLDLDFYKKVNNSYQSSSKKETSLYELRKIISNTYTESLDYEAFTVVDGIEMPLIVMKYRGDTIDSERMKNIEAPPGSTFNLGSKIKCYGQKWLVTAIDYNQQIKLSGQMQLCNYRFPFQDLETGEILYEDCVVYAYDNTASGESGNTVLMNYDTRRKIRVQYNEDTVKIERGRRFYIDLEGLNKPKVYRLTNIDSLTYQYNGHGFLEYTFTEDQESHITDRPDLMIADYIEPIDIDPIEPFDFVCKIDGRDTLKCGGSERYYKGIFYDRDANVDTSIIPIWSVTIPDGAENIIYFSISDGVLALRCENDFSVVGSTIILTLQDENKIYSPIQFEVKVVSAFG